MTHDAIVSVLAWTWLFLMGATLVVRVARLARRPPRLRALSLESILSSQETVETRLSALFVNARRMYVRDVRPTLFIVGTVFVVCAVYFAVSQPENALFTQLGNAALWLITALGVAVVNLFECWLSYHAARKIIVAAG